MKQIDIDVRGMEMGYATASIIAQALAATMEKVPTVVAWHDKPHARMSPNIEGGDIHSRWHDYGESFGGEFNITINGDYDFIFADAENFDTVESTAFRMVKDSEGHEYMCQANLLRDPNDPGKTCEQVDRERGAYGGHGGYA